MGQEHTFNKTGLTTSGVAQNLVAVGAGNSGLGVAEDSADGHAT